MLISVHFKLIKQNKSTAMRCMDNTAFPCRMSPTFSLLPQRAVPVSGTRSQGGYSLLKRECPPGPPKEKRGGISISPRTPLKRHKGAGCGPNTVMAIRFPALMGRQSCHFLGSGPLYPPPAALWCVHLWNPPPGDEGRGRKNQPPRGRRTRDEDKTGNGPGSA